MNILLDADASAPFVTDVGATLRALGIEASEFDWYVSDIETNILHDSVPATDRWMTGRELEQALAHQDLQFIWGVLSAFPIGERVDVRSAPTADGNGRYWQDADALEPQLKGALFEIVCWDSSATILVGLSTEQEQRYRAAFPEARPLRDASIVD